MNTLELRLQQQLERRRQAGNYRSLPTSITGTDFFTNDYLGLATHGLPNDFAFPATTAKGATGSRLLSGNHGSVQELEDLAAAHHQAEAALVFNTGYEANVGLLSAIAGRHTSILYDELCHASIIDGVRNALCRDKKAFAHNNTAVLEQLLEQQATVPEKIVVTESVFSMDGDTAPLEDMVAVCERHGALLVVDEAHATGVYGTQGEGLVVQHGLAGKVYARVHTFGKAVGSFGAVVVGSHLLRDYLINYARHFIYTTALPPVVTDTVAATYRYMASAQFSNKALHEAIAVCRQAIAASGDPRWKDSHSPIQTIVTGSNQSCRALALQLNDCGFAVKPILSPTVPSGTERIRICLHSFNTPSQIDQLVAAASSTYAHSAE